MGRITDTAAATMVFRDLIAAEDFTAAAVPRVITVTGTTDSPSTIKDAVFDNFVAATTQNLFDFAVTIPFGGYATGPATFASSNPAALTIDAHGIGSYVAPGTSIVTITVPGLGTKQFTVVTQLLGGQMSTAFSHFAVGSLGKHVVDGLNAMIAGKTPPDLSGTPPFAWNSRMNLFMPDGITRNPSCWIGAVDATCIPQFGQSGLYNGCLISPRDMVLASHYHNDHVGYFFTGNDGSTHYQIAQASTMRALPLNTAISTDITVVTFPADFPATITPATILPANFRSYLPQMQYGIPCIAGNQDRTLVIDEFFSDGGGGGRFDRITRPTDATEATWYYGVRSGDSGSPIFLPITGKLVFVTHWSGVSEGAVYSDNIAQLNAAMAANGSPYTVTTADLSGFTTY